MSSDLIFKRLFAVSFVLLALFVWGCEDDSSDSDSGPKTLIDLDSKRIDDTGEIQFYIDSFIKDEYIVLEDSELGTEDLADFWADVVVRWGLRQKMADSEATDEAAENSEAEASASEDSAETADEIAETFWLQRSENYNDGGDATEYQITAVEGEKQFFVLDPQDWKDYLPVEWSDISAGELEVVVEAFLATQTAEGQFQATASIELPEKFSMRIQPWATLSPATVADPKIYWEIGTTGFANGEDERDAALTLDAAPTAVSVGSDVMVVVSAKGGVESMSSFTYEWQLLDEDGAVQEEEQETTQGSAKFTFTAENPGIKTVKVEVSDDRDGRATAERKFDFKVAPAGLRVVNPSGSQILQLASGEKPSMTFEAVVDGEAEGLSYTWHLYAQEDQDDQDDQDDNGDWSESSHIIGEGASLEYQFSERAGRYLVKVEAQDEHGQAAQPASAGADSVEVQLNAQPELSFAQPTAGNSGTARAGETVDFAVTVSDEESSEGFRYQWESRAPGAGDWTQGAQTEAFTLATKGFAASEDPYQVRVTVKDEDGGSAEAVYQLTLEPNDAPEISFLDGTVADGKWLQLEDVNDPTEPQAFKVLARDEDGGELTYSWTVNGVEQEGETGPEANLTLYSPLKGLSQDEIEAMSTDEHHEVLVKVTVTDAMGMSSKKFRTLYVNVAPRIANFTKPSSGDSSTARVGQDIGFAVNVSDEESSEGFRYQWEYQAPGAGDWTRGAQTEAFTLATKALASNEDPYQVRVTVTDEDGGSAEATYGLTLQPNRAPTLEFADATVADGKWLQLEDVNDPTEPQTFIVQGHDEDGGELTYSWAVNNKIQKGETGPEANLTLYSPLKGLSQDVIEAMSADERHELMVIVTVTDDMGESESQFRKLYVNVKPTLEFGDATVAEDEWFQLADINTGTEPQAFTVEATDVEGDTLTYSWAVNGVEQTGETGPEASLTLYSPLKGFSQDKIEAIIELVPSADARHVVVVTATVKEQNGGSSGVPISRRLHVNVKPKLFDRSGDLSDVRLNFQDINSSQDVKFAVEGTDAEGDTLTYSWAVNGVPQDETGREVSLAVFSPLRDLSKNEIAAMSMPDRHRAVVEVTVSDGIASSGTIPNTVHVNVAPTQPTRMIAEYLRYDGSFLEDPHARSLALAMGYDGSTVKMGYDGSTRASVQMSGFWRQKTETSYRYRYYKFTLVGGEDPEGEKLLRVRWIYKKHRGDFTFDHLNPPYYHRISNWRTAGDEKKNLTHSRIQDEVLIDNPILGPAIYEVQAILTDSYNAESLPRGAKTRKFYDGWEGFKPF